MRVPTAHNPAANIAWTPLRIVSDSLPPGPETIITGYRLAGS
jgi:hypothetical protein